METPAQRARSQSIAFGLIAFGVLARLFPHPWNVTPVTALALFGGATLSLRWAIGLPLATIVLSDLVLGLHDVIAFTWSGVILTGLLGLWIRPQPTVRRIAIASGLASTLFFLLTNFGVWLVGDNGTMYPKTLQGLWQCYAAALPFYRNALLGDLVYSAAIFGVYAVATSGRLARQAARSS